MRYRRHRAAARLSLLLAATAAVGTACGGTPRPPERIVHFQSEIRSGRLSNGIRILVAEDHAINLVEVGIRFEVGSASDPAGKAGLAHLVEHLMFQLRRDGRPIGAEMGAVAVGFNAYTTWDATHYTTTARADQLDRVLELEGARFAADCASIPLETFEREREVVRNELRLRGGSSFYALVNLLVEQVYPDGHPYRRQPIGDDLQLSALTLADACDFVAAHYRPDRMDVVISGNVQWREAMETVQRHLGSLTGASRRAPPTYPALHVAGSTLRRRLPIDEKALLIAWPLPSEYSEDLPATSIALKAFERELLEEKQFGLTFELGGPRAPMAAVLVLLDEDDDPDRALASVWKALERTQQYDGGYDFDHDVNQSARALLTRFDALRSRVNGLADTLQFTPGRHMFVDKLHALDQLTPELVASAARNILTRQRATVLIAEPNGEPAPTLEQSRLTYRGRSHEADDWGAPVDGFEAIHPVRVPVAPSAIESAEELELENGLRVILLATPAAPVLTAHLVFTGGSADDPDGKAGLASLAANLLTLRRVGRVQAYETPVDEALYRFGDSLETRVGPDHTIFSVRGLSSHMDAMLAGLGAMLQNGIYTQRRLEAARAMARSDEDDLSPDRRDKLARLRADDDFRRAVYGSIYGKDHPYVRAAGASRDVDRISKSDLERYRERHFRARNGVLVITGQYDRELLKQHIEHWFGDLRSGQRQPLVRPPVSRAAGRAIVKQVSADDRPTTELVVAYPLAHDPGKEAARRVLVKMVDARVARVRHTLGAAYTVAALRIDHEGPDALLITAIVDARRADEAMRMLMVELEALRDPETDLLEDFARARREVLGQLLADESGANQSGERIVALVEKGAALDYYTRLAREVMNLTVDQLAPFLRDSLQVAHETIGIYGPGASVEAARAAIDETPQSK